MKDGKLERQDIPCADDRLSACFVGLTPKEVSEFAWWVLRMPLHSNVHHEWVFDLMEQFPPAPVRVISPNSATAYLQITSMLEDAVAKEYFDSILPRLVDMGMWEEMGEEMDE